jgi:pilus assembly protein Flp/PilA
MMKSFKQLLNNLMTDESGQDLIEYALIAALIGLGTVASLNGLSTSIGGFFNTVGNNLTSSV